MLTAEDWALLLQGAKRIQFAKDQVIVAEREQFQVNRKF